MIVELVALNTCDISMSILSSKKLLAKKLCKGKGSIISTWQHKAMEQLFDSKYVACLKTCGGTPDIRSYAADGDFLFLEINLPLLAKP